MINSVTLLGNLGNAPEEKNTTTDTKICTFSLATTKKTKNGDKTQWHNIKCFNKVADVALNYLHKGRKVYVEGEIEYGSYENAQGEKKYYTNIIANKLVLLDNENKQQEFASSNLGF